MAKKQVTIYVLRGVEGPSLCINDFRVAGPKPWGGGRIIHQWTVDEEGFLSDIYRLFPALRGVSVSEKRENSWPPYSCPTDGSADANDTKKRAKEKP